MTTTSSTPSAPAPEATPSSTPDASRPLTDRSPPMRRQLLWAGGAAAALLAGCGGGDDGSEPASDADADEKARNSTPKTQPYVLPLVHVNRPEWIKQEVALSPPPAQAAQTGAAPPEARREPHQAWGSHWAALSAANRAQYRMTVEPVQVSIHPALPLQDMWGYDGRVPGPTIRAHYGKPVMLRLVNNLPEVTRMTGYGNPELSLHLHNMHTPSESDGHPDNYFPKNAELDPADLDTARWRDFHYPNMRAGNDPNESLGTLWYHDHRHDFTAANTTRGLSGFYLIFDELDSGNENDPSPTALRLPSDEYDVPLLLSDRVIDRAGRIAFDQLNVDGIVGNRFLVNGRIQPYFQVEPRKYRLRLLAAGPARIFGLSLMANTSQDGPGGAVAVNRLAAPGTPPIAQIIATGGNLLPAPIPMLDPAPLGPSQRLDVVIDFSRLQGRTVYLVNRYEQTDGKHPRNFLGVHPRNGPQWRTQSNDGLIRFDIVKPLARPDASRVPDVLRPLPWNPADGLSRLTERQILDADGKTNPFPNLKDPVTGQPIVAAVRSFRFASNQTGQWTINDAIYDGRKPSVTSKLDSGEIWIFETGGGWAHPVHIHFEEHRTLFRNGIAPKAGDLEFGRDDTLLLAPGERAIIFRRFRDFRGKYVMHCHNTVHEDHGMMLRYDVA